MSGQAVLLPLCSPRRHFASTEDSLVLSYGWRIPYPRSTQAHCASGSETMNFRKNFARLGVACALSVMGVNMGVNGAAALDYPTKPVRWIVGYPAGGSTDILARLIGQWLSVRLGQQFIIENRPGAGNNLGTEQVVRAAPDGYTILLVNPANAINTTLYDKLSFN